MPIHRDNLEAGLAIKWKAVLNPMTPCAPALQFFIESRDTHQLAKALRSKSGKQREAKSLQRLFGSGFQVTSRPAKRTRFGLKPAFRLQLGMKCLILMKKVLRL